MQTYRKKPVEVEAVQLTEDADWEIITKWCGGYLINVEQGFSGEYETELRVSTLEGVMRARLGDWIIRGVRGEFYPCKPDIFKLTYEPVASSSEHHGYTDHAEMLAALMRCEKSKRLDSLAAAIKVFVETEVVRLDATPPEETPTPEASSNADV